MSNTIEDVYEIQVMRNNDGKWGTISVGTFKSAEAAEIYASNAWVSLSDVAFRIVRVQRKAVKYIARREGK